MTCDRCGRRASDPMHLTVNGSRKREFPAVTLCAECASEFVVGLCHYYAIRDRDPATYGRNLATSS